MVFGTAVAYRFGASKRSQRQFHVFFLICCVAGALVHVVIYPSSYQPLVGASAGISGLMAAALRILFIPPGASWRGRRPLARTTSQPILILAGLFVATNVLFGATAFGASVSGALIAWQAHLGGFFTGLFLIGLFARR